MPNEFEAFMLSIEANKVRDDQSADLTTEERMAKPLIAKVYRHAKEFLQFAQTEEARHSAVADCVNVRLPEELQPHDVLIPVRDQLYREDLGTVEITEVRGRTLTFKFMTNEWVE